MSEAQRKDLCAYGHVTTPIVNTAIQETWFINLFNQLNTFFSRLQGSLCNDYCVVNCCGPCVLCQLARELKYLQRWIANQLTTTRNHCFGTGTRSLNFDSTFTMWKWHTVAYMNKMQLIKEIVCLNQFIGENTYAPFIVHNLTRDLGLYKTGPGGLGVDSSEVHGIWSFSKIRKLWYP